ncbi:MAG: DNA translocase FtsK 4TM domain-containing protein, partial [Deltaproteobacteria bacterium]|nr:DNA translocase FtsK 4TM domain-containing protein [Deltaproteobacteria bacterium]
MTEPSKLKREALAIVFLTAGLYLALALVSFNQHDPSLSSASTPESAVRNWGGSGGAIVSDLLLQFFGIGAVGFPLICLFLAYWTFRGSGILGKWKRAAGGLLAVCSTLGILSFFAGHFSIFGQDVFLPGIAGELLGRQLLGKLLSTAGGVLLLAALLLFSLMLTTGLPLSGLPALWRREKPSEKVRAMVKEKLAPKEAWEVDPEADQRRETKRPAAPPRVVAPRPADEESPTPRTSGKAFVLPALDLLEPGKGQETGVDASALQDNAQALLSKLGEHGIDGAITEIRTGPLVTMYEFRPAPGIKAHRVSAMAGDLALAMRCESVRVIPNIPGKGVMGFEIPNARRSPIVLREMLGCPAYSSAASVLMLALGKDIFGEPVVRDLGKMPPLLIAGTTGSGKSVALHTMILSILYRATPEEVRLILVDPKMLELSLYDGIPHLYHPVVTQPRDAAHVLK